MKCSNIPQTSLTNSTIVLDEARSKSAAEMALNVVQLTLDWKMKRQSTRFREPQSDHFGKTGTIWHGIGAVVKLPKDLGQTAKVPIEGDEFEYHSKSYHHVSDDKIEDAFAVLSSLAEALVELKTQYRPK